MIEVLIIVIPALIVFGGYLSSTILHPYQAVQPEFVGDP